MSMPPAQLPPLRDLPSPVVDKWKQQVVVSADGLIWRARARPDVSGGSVLNWVLYTDLREGDTVVRNDTRLRRLGPGSGRGFYAVGERPEDGRRRIFSPRAIAVAQLCVAERAASLSNGGMVLFFHLVRYFGLWLAAHPRYLPEDRPFDWSDLTIRIVRAFLASELQTPRQGDAVTALRAMVEWGTDPETGLADFDPDLYSALKQFRLPSRPRRGAAALQDPRRGAFDTDELADILEACETFDVSTLGYGRVAALAVECGRATAWVLVHIGSRPVQLAALTKGDLVATPLVQRDPAAQAKTLYHLRVKRAKQENTEAEYTALSISRGCGELLVRLLDLKDPAAPAKVPLLWWLVGSLSYQEVATSVLRKFFKAADLRTRRLPKTPPLVPPGTDAVQRAHAAVERLKPAQRDAFLQTVVGGVSARRQARIDGHGKGSRRRAAQIVERVRHARRCLARLAADLDVEAVLRADRKARDPRLAFERLPVFVYRFRYGVATDRLRSGASLKSVARFLGHADEQVVRGYVENTPDISDEFQRATDWVLGTLVKMMRGRIDDLADPSSHKLIPGIAPHLARGRSLPVIGPIGKCAKNGWCDKNPVVSCFTCNDYIARPDGAETIRGLREAFVRHIDGLGTDASDVYVAQQHRALRAMQEWIAHLEEVERLTGQAPAPSGERVAPRPLLRRVFVQG